MLPFVDFVAAPSAALGLAALLWLRAVLGSLPDGPRFVCSPRPPSVGRVRLVTFGYAGLWLFGVALWLGGRFTDSPLGHFFGMIVLISATIACAVTAWGGRRRLGEPTATLEVTTDPPEAVLERDGAVTRVPLVEGAVRAWTVGSGASGPTYLQLAVGPSEDAGFALYVAPALRHWSLSEGASWLSAYAGLSPVARGPDLLDLLAPFTVPANQDWAGGPP